MLQLKNVTDVIVQGDYMSGDRNTIASALRVNDKLGILVITAKGYNKTGLELQAFFEAAASKARVELYTVDVAFPLPGPKPLSEEEKKKLAEEAVKKTYKESDNWSRSRRRPDDRKVTDKGKNATPAWVRTCVELKVRVHPATFGTGEIAKEYKVKPTETLEKLQKYWRLPDSGVGTSLYAAVGNYLASKGFRDNRRYVFLFTKEGDRNAEKAHHFTSILTWRILQERIERETTIIPVAVGDDIGLRTNPRMVKFWDDTEWKKIFEGNAMDGRTAQLGMWCYLAEKFKGVSIIGMRSGMIEVPALLGIHTLYLEEKHNGQAERMAKWLGGVVPTFERQVVEVPSGIKQQIYWNQASLKAPPHTPVHQHAVSQGGQVKGLVMGFENKKGDTQYKGTQFDKGTDLIPPKPQVGRSLAAKQPGTQIVDVNAEGKTPTGQVGAQVLAKAVFGPDGLAKAVPAEKFMLQTSEFKSIIEWVEKNTPTPEGAINAVHGYIDGRLEKKGEALNDLTAAKGLKTWSNYFSSAEFRAKIGADTPLNLKD
jgi:hypothetical protein